MDAAQTFDFQDSLAEIMRLCPPEFNDGVRAIIHLADACVESLPLRQPKDDALQVGSRRAPIPAVIVSRQPSTEGPQ
jgi:hypothetical protein